MTIPWKNEPMSALTHFVGAGLSIVGLVMLIVQGARLGSALHVTTFTIFGVCMFLTYLMSTLYHFFSSVHHPRTKRVFQILDHTAIYFLIAGTYTPVALVVLPPGWGWTIFGLIWAFALLGTIIKTAQISISSRMSVALYLAMGWLVVIALVPLTRALPPDALWRLVLGGISYTVGAVCFALDRFVPRSRWFGMHEVFHLFVMGGSFAHFIMFFQYFGPL
jgi:hemolysin III